MSLPSIIIAGFQKCGTTALHKILAQHSQVCGAVSWNDSIVGNSAKEIHFFDHEKNFAKGSDWYSGCFSQDGCQGIDATPEYIRSEEIIERMYNTVPLAKIILLMRDPVDRALSAWNHWDQARSWKIPKPNAGFEENVSAEVEKLNNIKGYSGFISRGFYIEQIKILERFYPPEQIFLSFTEELKSCHEVEIWRIQKFLELPIENLSQVTAHKRRYSTSAEDSEFIKYLYQIYEPYTKRPKEYMGRVLPWNNS